MREKHGFAKNGTKSSEYLIWGSMKARCYNTNSKIYHRYGGRGITISAEWINSFSTFYKDMGPKPSSTHSIDRIDNNRGYSKENCRWATKLEQTANTRQNRNLELNGRTMHVSGWARELGVSPRAIYYRLKQGWPVYLALTLPIGSISSSIVRSQLRRGIP